MSCRRGGSPSRAALSDLPEAMTGWPAAAGHASHRRNGCRPADGNKALLEGEAPAGRTSARSAIDGAWRREGAGRHGKWQGQVVRPPNRGYGFIRPKVSAFPPGPQRGRECASVMGYGADLCSPVQ
jgi:hypothetical protein